MPSLQPSIPMRVPTPRDLAPRLSSLLDEVVFSIEHGIPLSLVNDLSSLGRSLEALHHCGETAEALRGFRQAVDALLDVEPDAIDRLLREGARVVSSLETVE